MKKEYVIGIVVLVVIGIVAYFMLKGDDTSTSTTTTSTDTSSTTTEDPNKLDKNKLAMGIIDAASKFKSSKTTKEPTPTSYPEGSTSSVKKK